MTSDAFRHPDDLPRGLRFLAGGGGATRLILARDWTQHPLGPPEGWPTELKTSLSLLLNSPESMILSWGREELFFFFNETYFPLLGPRLSWAMGSPFIQVWADGWEQAKPIIDDAFDGRSQRFNDLPWKLATDRGEEDTWWTFSYSRVLDAEGDVCALFIFTNETTAKVRADAALRDLNASLERQVAERTADRNLAWQLSQELLVVVVPDGSFEAINPLWTELLGWQPHEVLGHKFDEFVHPDDLPRTMEVFGEVYQRPLKQAYEYRFLHKDGHYEWFAWTAAVEGDKVYASGRHTTHERLQAEQLVQAQKMEAVGQLTGGLAHDFNNLLAGISGSLELAGQRIRQGRVHEVDKYMIAAQGATKRAAALTHRLLAFSRRQTLAPKVIDVNELASGLLELVQRTVGPAIAVEFVGVAGLWSTLVDAPQLENALLNLCINARDAMPDGGRITIETANRWIDRDGAKQHDMPEGQYVSLCVSDTGTGMPPDVIAKAFDPFFTTKPLGQGTGLGLSMIYGFAKQSGGQVRIYSEVGEGTNVCIYLPRHLGDAERDDALMVTAPRPEGQAGETILVVDDEPMLRMLVTDVLDELGYTAIEAADSAGGLHVLQSDARVDLLITDVGLPGGMNGRQMADAARVTRPGLKVLFVTGYAENALLNNGQLEPGMSVLTKPFALDTLAARIRELIAK